MLDKLYETHEEFFHLIGAKSRPVKTENESSTTANPLSHKITTPFNGTSSIGPLAFSYSVTCLCVMYVTYTTHNP